MWKRSDGQSLVEMAFVGPILIFLLFGIIDMSYYIFAYSTLSQAVRNGAENAAQLPPREEWLSYKTTPPNGAPTGFTYEMDDCVSTILTTIDETAIFVEGDIRDAVTISYPNDTTTAFDDMRRNTDVRGPVEVSLDYNLVPLTPVFSFFRVGNNGTLRIQVAARRSIESLGLKPGSGNGDACAKDLADWQAKHPNP